MWNMTIPAYIWFIYVKRHSLLPGVTTLSMDLDRRPILGASNHYYLVFLSCGIFHCWSEENTGKHFKGFYFVKQVQWIVQNTRYYLRGKVKQIQTTTEKSNSQIHTNTVMYIYPSLSGFPIFTWYKLRLSSRLLSNTTERIIIPQKYRQIQTSYSWKSNG